ncbi:hypothetical protein OAC17_03335 [Flavobacteriaceae bacterium]|nr:hypothetical protein [Flavobacteriaceae bacterium]MDB9821751.1 hypothetical protein [Flavobacteriaceae bacterium]
MGVDQRTNRIKGFLFLFFTAVFCFAQESPPFLESDTTKRKLYEFQIKEVLNSEASPLEKVEQKIALASVYKEQKDVLAALQEKLILVGESAELFYLIAGTNGIIALQTNPLFSIPNVKAMLKNFDQSIKTDPSFVPSYEAYIEALCMVPSLLGGGIDKAKELAFKLEQLSPVQGYFAQGYIAKTLADDIKAMTYYTKGFDLLIKKNFCGIDLPEFFASKSMNFPYKIAEISAHNGIAAPIGICAIDYFIKNQTSLYNMPIEWAYFRKAQLHVLQAEDAEAQKWISKALEINPNFEQAKFFKQTHWSLL